MPVYTYRREDGTTFDVQQKFLDDPLEVCPTTGQKVVRVIQMPGIIFKGSGFYVNDSKSSKQSLSSKNGHSDKADITETSENGSASAENKASSGESKASSPESKAEKKAS